MGATSRLQRYVLTEVVKTFLPALIVFILIMMLGFCVQLLNEGLDVVRLAGLPSHILSFSLPLVLPSAFLTAIVMGFGRLSGDNEVTAMRVSGVNLLHILWPVGVLALLLSCVAAYLQFESVPRAHTKIELLKYEALKQILIDKMALSSGRQFSFPNCYVQYDDFRGGEMHDVLIVGVDSKSGVPTSIITASTGRVGPDPEHMEFIRLTLKDSVLTELNVDPAGAPLTTEAGEAIRTLRVTPDQKDIGQGLKHLSFGKLLKRLGELTRDAGQYPETYARPEDVRGDANRKIQELSAEAAELDKGIERREEKLKKLTQDNRIQCQSMIDVKQEDIRDAEKNKAQLQNQQVTYTDKRNKLEAGGEASANVELSIELGRLLEVVGSKIGGLDQKIKEAKEEIQKQRAKMQEDEVEAREVKQELSVRRSQKERVQQELKGQQEARYGAVVQEDLRSLLIRIHKRLAQAFAVFAFAMIGMPLGIMTRRRSVMVAFGVSFAIVLILFYPFLVIGQMAAENGLLPTVPAMWSGNIVISAIGVLLTARALRQ